MNSFALNKLNKKLTKKDNCHEILLHKRKFFFNIGFKNFFATSVRGNIILKQFK